MSVLNRKRCTGKCRIPKQNSIVSPSKLSRNDVHIDKNVLYMIDTEFASLNHWKNKNVCEKTGKITKIDSTYSDEILTKLFTELNSIHSSTLSIPIFSLDGYTTYTKICSVYDGDTMTCIFPLPGQIKPLYRWKCRIIGIDTPEIRTKDILEKQYGIYVRDKVRELLLNHIVKIKCYQYDKYGRVLVDIIMSDGMSFSQWIIENKYGFEYGGGTKKSWGDYLRENEDGKSIVNRLQLDTVGEKDGEKDIVGEKE